MAITTNWTTISSDVFFEIICFLDVPQIIDLKKVCRTWKDSKQISEAILMKRFQSRYAFLSKINAIVHRTVPIDWNKQLQTEYSVLALSREVPKLRKKIDDLTNQYDQISWENFKKVGEPIVITGFILFLLLNGRLPRNNHNREPFLDYV